MYLKIQVEFLCIITSHFFTVVVPMIEIELEEKKLKIIPLNIGGGGIPEGIVITLLIEYFF